MKKIAEFIINYNSNKLIRLSEIIKRLVEIMKFNIKKMNSTKFDR